MTATSDQPLLCNVTVFFAYFGCGIDTIRYDTRCYFNVRSKADISQLNLPHGLDTRPVDGKFTYADVDLFTEC